MSDKAKNTEQGHWILAKMGKRVLRPGGRELTVKIIAGLQVDGKDSIVEFAPGMGYTASLLLAKKPLSYTGIELNEEAATRLQHKITTTPVATIINASASKTGLPDSCATKVIGEAMLTMQADQRKSEIIHEAFRILKKGGLYGIHELGLTPDTLDQNSKDTIQRELAKTIRVNARPLTKKEWCLLLEREGFKVKEVFSSPMHLLRPGRLLSDEGFFRVLKIGFNVITHPKERKRILAMRNIFQKYNRQMTAFGIIAEKP